MNIPLASTHPHYRSMDEAFARQLTTLARDYKRHQGRDPEEVTLADVYELLSDTEYLMAVVNATIHEDGDGNRIARIDADWLSEDVREWLEQVYLPEPPARGNLERVGVLNSLQHELSSGASQ